MSTNFKGLTLEQRLAKFPPFLCLALSHVKIKPFTKQEMYARWKQRQKGKRTVQPYQWRRMNREEIAKLSGIHYRRAARIGRQINWNGVAVDEMLAFMRACKIDLCHAEKHRRNMKRRSRRGDPFRHLTSIQRQVFVETMRRYKAAMVPSAPSSPEPPSAIGSTVRQ